MSEDKQRLIFDGQLLEDLLYIGCVRSMQLQYSSPKFIVTSNEENNIFNIHCVFPFVGTTGSIIDVDLDTDKINNKSLDELLDVLANLRKEIIEKVQEQIERISIKRKELSLDNEE